MVYRCLERIHSLLFPSRCVLCARGGGEGICAPCRAEFPAIGFACRTCSAPLAFPGEIQCGDCQLSPPHFDKVIAAYCYAPPLDHLVLRLKFHGDLALVRPLAGLLQSRLQGRTDLPQALIPVPLHPSRLRERGFNQALELARVLGRTCGIAVDYHACERVRATVEQTRLPATKRRANVRNAFRVLTPPPTHIALVDDVLTTGHTVSELARVLRKAGAERIEVWVVARTG